MKNRNVCRIFQVSHFFQNAHFLRRVIVFALVGFFALSGAWGSEQWSGVKNDHGESTNFRSDSGGFTFDLTGDTQWNGNLILGANNYDIVINLNGYSLYIYRLCIGWIDSDVSYKLKLIININQEKI